MEEGSRVSHQHCLIAGGGQRGPSGRGPTRQPSRAGRGHSRALVLRSQLCLHGGRDSSRWGLRATGHVATQHKPPKWVLLQVHSTCLPPVSRGHLREHRGHHATNGAVTALLDTVLMGVGCCLTAVLISPSLLSARLNVTPEFPCPPHAPGSNLTAFSAHFVIGFLVAADLKDFYLF